MSDTPYDHSKEEEGAGVGRWGYRKPLSEHPLRLLNDVPHLQSQFLVDRSPGAPRSKRKSRLSRSVWTTGDTVSSHSLSHGEVVVGTTG